MAAAPGTPASFVAANTPGLSTCPATYLSPSQSVPEKFWNCADISIRSEPISIQPTLKATGLHEQQLQHRAVLSGGTSYVA